MNWNTQHIPDQTGKVAIITGGNRGLGFEISLQLAKKNATLIIACRSAQKGKEAVEKIKQQLHKNIDAVIIPLDLTDLKSIHSFASIFNQTYSRLDILINNAAVVNLKDRTITPTGLEMHMATNHYGHFALTGLLYPVLKNTPDARVVTMSSGGHKFGDLNFDDLNWERRPYHRTKSYGDSKLANLFFARSLQHKFDSDGISAISVAAHPGLTATERQQTKGIGGWFSKKMAQPVWKGALPALRAATDPHVQPLDYYGPRYGISGYPSLAKMDKKTLDKDTAKHLWNISEQVTGIYF